MEQAPQASVEREVRDGFVLVKVAGRLDRENAPTVLSWIETWLPREKSQVGLDLTRVEYIDSAGVAILSVSLDLARRRGVELRVVGASEAARRTLDLFRFQDADGPLPGPQRSFFEEMGDRLVKRVTAAREVVMLMADTFFWAVIGPVTSGRGAPRGELTRQAMLLGSRAFGIVALLAFLIGVTMALLSAHQLRQFGGNIYAANLVALAMAREMGPMMTAIIVAGRSGSAIAAEIATMRVTEEVDALASMGFSPVRFLVVPKLYAVTLTQPLLTAVAVCAGILGGTLIGTTLLGVPASAFLQQAGDALMTKDIMTGLLKSIVFGWTILVVAAASGLDTRGGAEAVGASTTRSVVVAIFGVIVIDLIFSLVFYV